MRRFQWDHGRREIDADVQRELDFHLAERARELAERGTEPGSAEALAQAEFGDRDTIEREVRMLRTETVRSRRRRNAWEDLREDVRVALRGLRRTPAFSVVALLTLALGIGANSAVFSVVRSVLLRPLPYPAADRLMQVWTDVRLRTGRANPEWLTPPDFADWRERNQSFSSMAAYQAWQPVLTGSGDPVALGGLLVTGDYFAVLGARVAIGRTLTGADDEVGAEPVVVISDSLWRSRFGGDRSIVNREIQLNNQSWRVVGVLEKGFIDPVPFTVSLIRPMRRPATSGCGRGCVVLRAIGRLKPGVTPAQAQQDFSRLAAVTAEQFPATNRGVGAWLIPLHEQITGPTGRPLLALTGAVVLVLLIACVNLAHLLLLRGAGRARELSVRAALGASRGRVVRQLLAESGVISVLGGVLGLAVGMAGSDVLAVVVPASVRDIQPVRVDGVVVGYTIAITMVAGMLFGLLPSIQVARRDVMLALRSGGRDTGQDRRGVRHGLVTAQLALAVMLLVGAGLLVRSLLNMQRVDLGYRDAGVLLENVALPSARYAGPTVPVTVANLLARLRADPAIRAAELTDDFPLTAGDQDITAIPVGEPAQPDRPQSIWYRSISTGYLRLMRIHLNNGRYFTEADRQGTTPVGIVNEEAVKRFWGGKSPVGRVLAAGTGSTAPRVTIVGVVATGLQDGPNLPPKAELFLPYDQQPDNTLTLVIEPAQGAIPAAAALQRAMHDVDAQLPYRTPTAMEAMVGDAVRLPRMYATLIGAFACAALLLAVIGVYGVQAYAVAQRQGELGVRLALGASPGAIRGLLFRQAGGLVLVGTIAGLIGAAALARLLGSLLFGVRPIDPVTYILVPLLLAVTGLVACWIPVQRAVRIDPLTVMRRE